MLCPNELTWLRGSNKKPTHYGSLMNDEGSVVQELLTGHRKRAGELDALDETST